jgi:hypothetical protein
MKGWAESPGGGGCVGCSNQKLRDEETKQGESARNLTSHSTGADSACMSFARSDASLNPSRPVNSGVRRLRDL